MGMLFEYEVLIRTSSAKKTMRKKLIAIAVCCVSVVVGLRLVSMPNRIAAAAKQGDIEVLRSYIDSGGDVNAKYWLWHRNMKQSGSRSLLYWAVYGKSVTGARMLLKSGAKLGAETLLDNPGREAVYHDDAPTMEVLMDYGLNTNDRVGGISLLDDALKCERWSVAVAMIARMTFPDWQEIVDIVHWRDVSDERSRAVAIMINLGMSPDLVVDHDKTLLTIATQSADSKLVEVLVVAGANPKKPNADGSLPIDKIPQDAVDRNKIIDLLSSRGQ